MRSRDLDRERIVRLYQPVGNWGTLDGMRAAVRRAEGAWAASRRACSTAPHSDRFGKRAGALEAPLLDRNSRVGFAGLLLKLTETRRVTR